MAPRPRPAQKMKQVTSIDTNLTIGKYFRSTVEIPTGFLVASKLVFANGEDIL